ncbi:hypothetical protein [Mameliella alba]|uniref:Lipoprotein n=1 Tax=Mameliella alba TaxID=561184 RepID=A0A0B3SIF5_9RHOB|nr:hypothetical protein [Mameliella alba]KHQ50354.1 hypothetical protein OA50_05029 [Mameliella alba]
MNRIATLVFVGVIALGGCGPKMNYVLDTYKADELKVYSIQGQVWRIFDKPDIGKMMIATSVDTAAAEGARQGATFYLARDRWTTDPEFRPAATAYLAQRGCTITGGRLLLKTQFEYDYTC